MGARSGALVVTDTQLLAFPGWLPYHIVWPLGVGGVMGGAALGSHTEGVGRGPGRG